MTYFDMVLITDVTRERDFENVVDSCDIERVLLTDHYPQNSFTKLHNY